jgi:soluble lytic murein transglycosylase-like protein
MLTALFVAIVPLGSLFPTKLNGPGRLEVLAQSGKLGGEVLRIYSLIKLNGADFSEKHAWKIAKTIARESRTYSIDPMLVMAVINVESRFRVNAVSEDGARGLMQIRPEAALEVSQLAGSKTTATAEVLRPESLHDPATNIKIGVSYLSYLQKRFRDLKLTLTAYNWGPTKTQKTLDDEEAVPEEYATKVLETYDAYREKKIAPSRWKAA